MRRKPIETSVRKANMAKEECPNKCNNEARVKITSKVLQQSINFSLSDDTSALN